MSRATQPRAATALPPDLSDGVEWRVSPGLTPYPEALAAMEARAAAIRDDGADELVWLLEHPPLFTAGTSADPAELFNPEGFPVFAAGRGGRYTYHGPGQRVVYAMLDLDRRGRDLRNYVRALEGWAIAALGEVGVQARRAEGRIGIWTDANGREAKIGAIGVRVRRWVTMHGLAINAAPELSHFSGIVPCGIRDFPVTSLAELGLDASPAHIDQALRRGLEGFLTALDRRGGEA
jgi:lipoyl(octanoyl) transferase